MKFFAKTGKQRAAKPFTWFAALLFVVVGQSGCTKYVRHEPYSPEARQKLEVKTSKDIYYKFVVDGTSIGGEYPNFMEIWDLGDYYLKSGDEVAAQKWKLHSKTEKIVVPLMVASGSMLLLGFGGMMASSGQANTNFGILSIGGLGILAGSLVYGTFIGPKLTGDAEKHFNDYLRHQLELMSGGSSIEIGVDRLVYKF